MAGICSGKLDRIGAEHDYLINGDCCGYSTGFRDILSDSNSA